MRLNTFLENYLADLVNLPSPQDDYSLKILDQQIKNLRHLADSCMSDNDGHLNEVKNCRMRLNTVLENYLSDLINSEKRAKLKVLSPSELEKLSDFSLLPPNKMRQFVRNLEERYNIEEKGTTSSSFSTGLINLFKWRGF